MVVLDGFGSSVVVVLSGVVDVVDGGNGVLVVVLVSGGLVVDGGSSDVVLLVLIGSLVDVGSFVDEDEVVGGSLDDVDEMLSLVVAGGSISLLLLGLDDVGSMLSVDWLGGILVELLSVGGIVLVGSMLLLSLASLV